MALSQDVSFVVSGQINGSRYVTSPGDMSDDTKIVSLDELRVVLADELAIIFSGSTSESFAELVRPSIAVTVWNRLYDHSEKRQSSDLL
jgi:hypothetical protein